MNKKKISQLLLASSAIVTTFATTNHQVFAKEISNTASSQSIYESKNQSIMGTPQATKDELKNYFKTLNIKNSKLSVSIDEFINIAYEEGTTEGVRGDLIVAQAFLETGYFTYGGDVKPQDNNFAGIGAIGGNVAGNTFKDVREGIRAQVQHLKAYGSTNPLVNSIVDPRFKYVTRGSATNIEALSGKWAYPGYDKKLYSSYEDALNAGNTYGQRVYSIIQKASKKHTTTPDVQPQAKPDVKPDNKESVTAIKGQVINVSTNVRLRQSASTSSMVLGYLSNEQLFNIKGKSGDWYNIEHNGMVGYIHKDYVKEMIASIPIPPVTPEKNNPIISDSNNKTQVSSKGTVVNVSTNLRIRKDSNSKSAIVGYLVNGESFDIKEQQGDWYKIEQGDKKGYVHKDYVKKSSDTSNKNEVAITAKPNENTTITNTTNVPKDTTTNTVAVVAKPTAPESNLKGQIINVSTNLRIRKGPSTTSSVVGYLVNGQNLTIKEKNGSWYSIQCGDKVGYVHSDYVKVLENNIPTPAPVPVPTPTPAPNVPEKTPTPSKNEIGTVYNVSSNVRLRNMPNSSSASSTLAYLLPSTSFTILGMSGDWYNVNYNGKIGYIYKDYVKKGQSTTDTNISNSKSYEKILNVLQSQIGTPYIFGGAGETLNSNLIDRLKKAFPSEAARGIYDISPEVLNKGYKAFDCSGLMQWAFKQAGINIGRTTWDQITNGTEVSLSNLKPGDLLFYSSLQHVGIYIGNGKWIEAPNSRNTIRVIDVPWNKIGRARRIIN